MTLSHANPNTYTRAHWAKSDRDNPGRIHLLEHHLADVGACMEALLAQPTIRGRLASAAGRDDIDEATAARLAVFAALHDIGKVNVGFQTQIWQPADWQGARRPNGWGRGHTRDIVPVIIDADKKTADWFFDALGFEDLLEWDADEGETASSLFVATLSHHGEPLNLEGGPSRNPSMWQAHRGLDPKACVERIGRLARAWFPAAFARNAPPLPSAPEFQHMFLGLCTLADWLGSDETRFPFQDAPQADYIATARRQAKAIVREVGLDIAKQREGFGDMPDFADLFNLSPNAIQRAAYDVPLNEPLAIIESATGSGKTEAALWRFARLYDAGRVDGMYFALPTRAAAAQIYERVNLFRKRLFTAADAPEPVLAVPGYIRSGDLKGKRGLQRYEVWWDDHATDRRRWAAESAKRFLAAQIAVGTIDQAMMAALKVRHSHMRAACLARNLLVVDEVHASDAYMRRILEALLDAHIGAGGYALLMSATLGSDACHRLLTRSRKSDMEPPSIDDAVKAAYPSVATAGYGIRSAGENDRRKRVVMEVLPAMQNFERTAQLALQAAKAGAKTLVIRNTVRNAIATQQAIERAAGDDADALFACNGKRTLHHSRFAAPDRHMLDAEIEALLGKDTPSKGCVVVGTQTLEQSLDIDADILITDLCPADVLLQRIGRLHRHSLRDRPDGYGQARCIVLTPSNADLSPLLSRSVNGLGTVYKDLRILEATRRLIHENPEWRIPEMNRSLVERATHPTALKAITAELVDDWRVHANNIEGGVIADVMNAASAVVRRDKTFNGGNSDVVFGDMQQQIRTRLGDEGIEVEFVPPPKTPKSPFDASVSIEKLTIPARLLRGQSLDAAVSEEPIAPTTDADGFHFSINGANFRYDRLGLQELRRVG